MTAYASEVIRVNIDSREMAQIIEMARACNIGGVTHVRQERGDTGLGDQITGMIGEAAFSKWVHGSIAPFLARRKKQNQTPNQGDNGDEAYAGRIVDIKTSNRKSGIPLRKYHLPVRPHENHKMRRYVQAVCEFTVYLVGWADGEELPAKPAEDGPLAGAHVLGVSDLHPMNEIREGK